MDMSSPKSDLLWLAELENDVDDPMLLQEFLGDCLIDYPPETMTSLLNDQELDYTLSAASECNSSTVSVKRLPDQCRSSEEAKNLPVTTKVTKRAKRLPDQCQSHIIAERQRRLTLSQYFIALSALIPGLKKMDKTTVLGEAITHMKELKDRVKNLEEENTRRAVNSVVVVQRSRVVDENENNSSDSHSTGLTQDEQFPDVEARFSNRSVLIKIHCPMCTGVLPRIFNQIENFNLMITNTNSMPFNDTTLDITIVTQAKPEFDMRPQEVVASLRSIF